MNFEFRWPLQVLVLEPSKLFQPAIVSVSEEDESCTVQLKHVTPFKVIGSSAGAKSLIKLCFFFSPLYIPFRLNVVNIEQSKEKIILLTLTHAPVSASMGSVWVYSSLEMCEKIACVPITGMFSFSFSHICVHVGFSLLYVSLMYCDSEVTS